MKHFLTISICYLMLSFTFATASTSLPEVAEATPSSVKNLPAPKDYPFNHGITMAITAKNEVTQNHVIQGLNHLHFGWDFEASRHFALAMQEDPDCLMAHWGMIMSLLNHTAENQQARLAATERLLHLIEQNQGSELERGYAYGLVKFLDEGPDSSANAYRKVSEKFPNDLQSVVFQALFQRGGYDELGTPSPTQEKAEATLLELGKKHPACAIPHHALLLIRAEAPNLEFSLPLVRELCEQNPNYPPLMHLLGHYLWRSGHHSEAIKTFAQASNLYKQWMDSQKIPLDDCPEWIRSESYRCVALNSSGDFDQAYRDALALAKTTSTPTRPQSPGARAIRWDAQSLPARLGLHPNSTKKPSELLQTFPSAKSLNDQRVNSLSPWWIDGLKLILDAKKLIAETKLVEAATTIEAIDRFGPAMAQQQKKSGQTGERSEFTQAFRAFEILSYEVRGDLALASSKNRARTAYNWYSSAADRQRPSPFLCSPMILSPMKTRLGNYLLQTQSAGDAIEPFKQALLLFPRDTATIKGLIRAYETSGDSLKADSLKSQLSPAKAP